MTALLFFVCIFSGSASQILPCESFQRLVNTWFKILQSLVWDGLLVSKSAIAGVSCRKYWQYGINLMRDIAYQAPQDRTLYLSYISVLENIYNLTSRFECLYIQR